MNGPSGGQAHESRRRWHRDLGVIFVVALFYAAAGIVGRLLEMEPVRASTVWPAAGVALAALLLRGRRMWPGIFVGAFVGSISRMLGETHSLPAAIGAAAIIAAAASICAVLEVTLIRRYAPGSHPPHDLRGLVALIGFGAILGPFLNAAIGSVTISATGYLHGTPLITAGISWWLGDAIGVLVVAPPLLLLGDPRRIGPSRSIPEAIALAVLLFVVAALAFGPWVSAARQYPLAHLSLPLLVWACLRFRLTGAVIGNLFVATLGTISTMVDYGPFAAGTDVAASLRMLQLFVAVVSITFLVLAAVMEERATAHEALAATRRNLELRVAERTSALRHSLALVRATLDATADGILVVDRNARLVSHNRRYLELWHIARRELETHDSIAATPTVLEQVQSPARFMALVKKLEARPEAEGTDVVDLRDGRIFERSSRPQWLDGEPVGRVWSFRDVTARIRLQRERDRLLVQEKEARQAAEEAHGRTAFLSDATRALAAAPSFGDTARRVVGLAIEAGGQLALLVLIRGGAPQVEALAQLNGRVNGWLREVDGGEPPGPDLLGQIRETLEAGHTRQWTRTDETGPLLCIPIASRGRFVGVLAVGRGEEAPPYSSGDIVVLEALAQRSAVALENAALLREAQEAVRVREDFLSIASHELKTPLTTLKLQVQKTQRVVRSQPCGEQLPALLDSVARQTSRLHALIDELLDLSRITAHRIVFETERVDLAELARQTIERASSPAARTSSPISLQVKGDPTGDWDRVRLEQVVENLVSNAIKYGAGKPIEIRIDGLGDQVIFQVEDHGIGISEGDQARIFERFERAVASRHYGGFGLGLWIVRQVVEAMGGTIGVESSAGSGSTFSVAMPRKVAPLVIPLPLDDESSPASAGAGRG